MALPSASGASLPKAALVVAAGAPRAMTLTFRYNPTSYSVKKGATWSRTDNPAAESSSKPEFRGVKPATISMDIFLDAFEEPSGDVTGDINTLFSWLKPTAASLALKKPQPPLLQFIWGPKAAMPGFVGFLTSVSAKYTMFRQDGTPVRATASISLEEAPGEMTAPPKKQNPTSGALESRRARVVQAGESLQSIAYAEFEGSAKLWRGLARFNHIDDPTRVPPGTLVVIPTKPEARRLTEAPE